MPNEALIHVIDDDDAVRRSLKFLLECSGYEVRDHDSALADFDTPAELAALESTTLVVDHEPGGK